MFSSLRDLFTLIDGDKEASFKKGWSWVKRVNADIAQLSEAQRDSWSRLLTHAATATSPRPSGKWLKTASELVEEMGSGFFAETTGNCIEHVLGDDFDSIPLKSDVNGTLIKGLVWTASLVEDEKLVTLVYELAEFSFRKVPGHGPGSAKVGNAAVYALGALPGIEAISRLTALKSRVKYAQAQALIEKSLERAAQERGLSVDALEELAVPTHGLDRDGQLRRALGNYTAVAEMVSGGKMVVRWIRPDGKVIKTAPKVLREGSPDELRSLRREVKEITKTWRAQRDRLERMLIRPTEWQVADWRDRYLEHPLMQHHTRRLVWAFVIAESETLAIWHEGKFVNSAGAEVFMERASSVSLWHPIGHDAATVLAWRRFLESRETTQPFKQAHREVYVLTDAEREAGVYSNRFAGHILRQHQFSSLCRERGWEYRLQGQFDSWNIPIRRLPNFDLTVEFYCEAIGDDNPTSEMGIYLYVSTDQVRFIAADRQPMSLERVPERIFSELMRDVDLFVGVCSIGNDPNWSDHGLAPGYGIYWEDYAFGELSQAAETRREVLEGLLPKLKIASRCNIDGRYLVVRGDIRTYRIHIGSGNIQMEPNGQYLCIVQGNEARSGAPRVLLPFEGDAMLSLILSKAVLLAADTKIKDRSIISQIGKPAD